MTKLASDLFPPSGAIDIPTNGPIAGATSHSGLDNHRSGPPMALSGDVSSPCGKLLSWPPHNSDLPSGYGMQSLTMNSSNSNRQPHLNFSANTITSDVPAPFSALNSQIDTRAVPGNFFHPNVASLSPPASWDIGGASLARSVSADAAVPTQASSGHYNGASGHSSVMNNWRLERSNLDALRRRAEQLYRDQQAVIDEMSEEWLKEKAEMSQLIRGLRERVQRLEGENTILKSIASRSTSVPGLVSPQNSLRSGSLGGFHGSKSPSPQRLPGRTTFETSAAFSLPPGLDGASRRPHFVRQGASPCVSPDGAPIIGGLGSLSPRTEPQQSAPTDFLVSSSSPKQNGGVPIIDVQEIDPKLEGIPIKVMAVQKSTFEPQSIPSTIKDVSIFVARIPSPPVNAFQQAKRKGVWGAWEREKMRNDRRRAGLAPLTTTKDQEQAKHILAADESRRLTMHAGHTPNHSLSLFPTMTATESSSAAARSQETTPTAWPSSNLEEHHGDTGASHVTDDAETRPPISDSGLEKQIDGAADTDIEGYLEPADDVPLKGPLMIKNIPAQDELFWAQVNQRLDPISRGEDALPRVLQSPELKAPPAGEGVPPEDSKVLDEPNPVLESDGEAEDGNAPVEPDVPLKFKTTLNFGAPFGTTS